MIRPYSKKELAHAYEVSSLTLRNWLKPFNHVIGEYKGRKFTPKQVECIFERLGEPKT